MEANSETPKPPSTLPEPAPHEQGFDLWRIYTGIIKRLWLVGIVAVVVVTVVAFYTFRQTSIYTAEASVVIDLTPPQVLQNVQEVVPLGSGSFWSTREYFETQYRIIRSRAVAEKVVARLGLDHNDAFLGLDPAMDPVKKAQIYKALDPVEMVIDRISVRPVKDSRVVVIAVEDPNPQLAADLVNAVAEEYMEQNVDRKLATTHNAAEWLVGRLGEIRSELEKSEKALYQFKVDHDVLSTSLEARQNITSERLVAISDALTKTALRRVELEARRQALQEVLAQSKSDEFKAESFKPIADNALIMELKREYFRLQAERAELAERYLADHPKRVALEERIAKVRGDVTHAIQIVIDSTETEFREASDEERRLKNMLEQSKQEALAVNKLEVQYEQLKREKDHNQTQYEQMVKRQKDVDVAGMLRTNNIRLLDAALVPKYPSRPNRSRNVMFAMLIGLLMGLALAILLEFFDNTVKSQDDIEKGLGLPLLGILPSIPVPPGDKLSIEATAKRDLYVSASPNSAVSECARSIRTSLLFASPDRPFKVLLVASTGPREGKSTAAVAIGITMAQNGNRVLVIDGDLRRPRLHKTFGVPTSTGLSTLILG